MVKKDLLVIKQIIIKNKKNVFFFIWVFFIFKIFTKIWFLWIITVFCMSNYALFLILTKKNIVIIFDYKKPFKNIWSHFFYNIIFILQNYKKNLNFKNNIIITLNIFYRILFFFIIGYNFKLIKIIFSYYDIMEEEFVLSSLKKKKIKFKIYKIFLKRTLFYLFLQEFIIKSRIKAGTSVLRVWGFDKIITIKFINN